MFSLLQILTRSNQYLWSGPLLVLLLGVGLWQTFQLKGLQFRYLLHSFRLLLSSEKSEESPEAGVLPDSGAGDLSPFQALMTALAGSVGTGNITGVAVAVTIGGYGALFWMWVVALIGMVTAYSEALLAVKFRVQSSDPELRCGGPMHTLERGLGMNKTAKLFALLCILASFGIGGTVQSNSVSTALFEGFGLPVWITGLVMGALTAAVVLGGVKSIGRAAGFLVPFMSILYLGAGTLTLFIYREHLGSAISLIVSSAFDGQAATGAFMGATAMLAIQHGVANGIFANEAGLGSLSLAAASAATRHPARQGMLGMCCVFIATMLICSCTGLVIAVTHVLGTQDPSTGEMLTGSALTIAAFSRVHSSFSYVVVIGLMFFAFTTVLAWAYYGEQCLKYLFGPRVAKYYRLVYSCAVFAGVFLEPYLVWAMANLANGLMAIPNLIAVFRLSPVIKSETQSYLATLVSKR